jgi:hypothetical protein
MNYWAKFISDSASFSNLLSNLLTHLSNKGLISLSLAELNVGFNIRRTLFHLPLMH